MSIQRLRPGEIISDAVSAVGTVWVAGMVAGAEVCRAGIAEQVRSILGQLDERLAAMGSHKEHLLFVNIWLVDIADWAAVNEIWVEWLGAAEPPARATVQAGLIPPYRIEIAATALVSEA